MCCTPLRLTGSRCRPSALRRSLLTLSRTNFRPASCPPSRVAAAAPPTVGLRLEERSGRQRARARRMERPGQTFWPGRAALSRCVCALSTTPLCSHQARSCLSLSLSPLPLLQCALERHPSAPPSKLRCLLPSLSIVVLRSIGVLTQLCVTSRFSLICRRGCFCRFPMKGGRGCGAVHCGR